MVVYNEIPPRPGARVDERETLLRFVRPDDMEEARPTIAALSLRPNEDVSVSALGLLRALGCDESAVVEGRPGYGVFSFDRSLPSLAGLSVVHRPIAPAVMLADPAHVEIAPRRNAAGRPDKAHWQIVRGEIIEHSQMVVAPDPSK